MTEFAKKINLSEEVKGAAFEAESKKVADTKNVRSIKKEAIDTYEPSLDELATSEVRNSVADALEAAKEGEYARKHFGAGLEKREEQKTMKESDFTLDKLVEENEYLYGSLSLGKLVEASQAGDTVVFNEEMKNFLMPEVSLDDKPELLKKSKSENVTELDISDIDYVDDENLKEAA